LERNPFVVEAFLGGMPKLVVNFEEVPDANVDSKL